MFLAQVNSFLKKFLCCGSKNIKPSIKISAFAIVGDCSINSVALSNKFSSSVNLSTNAALKSSVKSSKSRSLSLSSSLSTKSAASFNFAASIEYVRSSFNSSDKISAKPCCLAARTKNFKSPALSRRKRIFLSKSRRPISEMRGIKPPPISSKICLANRLKLFMRVLKAPPVKAANSNSARYV